MRLRERNRRQSTLLGLRPRSVAVLAAGLLVILGALFAASNPQSSYANPVPPPACTFDNDSGSAFQYLQTYEAANPQWKTTYARTMELAGFNQLFPELASYNFNLGTMDNAATPYVPPTLLKAIGWLESNWTQASWGPVSPVPYDRLVDYGQVGPALVSFDCGYGIMQVTSGMQNESGVPGIDQAMIAGNYAFNIARGAHILVDKWNLSPEYRPVVGSRDSKLLSDYYFAVWGYNGFAFDNHPLNPVFDPLRPSFSCGPAGDGFGHDRGQYPYQELVYGCLAHPPVVGGTALWTAIDAKLPNLQDPQFSGPLDVSHWGACAQNFQCGPMNIPSPDTTHKDPTTINSTRAQIIGTPAMGLSQSTISMTVASGATATSPALTISNTGGGVLSWLASSSAPWLLPSAWQGVAVPGQTASLKAVVNAVGLVPGVYSKTITLASLYPQGTLGTITVEVTVTGAPPPTVTPSPTPSPTPTPPPDPQVIPGDADCDKLITVFDAVGMMQYVAQVGVPPCVTVADWNCDGDITLMDALGVLIYVAYSTPSPCLIASAAPALEPAPSATPTPTAINSLTPTDTSAAESP